jgi:hypothetical protein
MTYRNLLTLCILVAATSSARAQLTAIGSEYWNQHVPGMPGDPDDQDAFGRRVATGDFDGDGYQDLAVGISGDGVQDAGSVHVFYGGPSGFTVADSQLWNQESPGIPGDDEPQDLFGLGLGVGDFDADGYDDLAIGIPGKTINAVRLCGSVLILHGSVDGLTSTGVQLWNDLNLPIALDFGDVLGISLASGYFDGDEYADLAMSVPGETVLGATRAGAVLVLYGSLTGLTQVGVQTWHQDVTGVLGATAVGDSFGSSLTSGNFDGDAFDDLAIGVPGDIVSGVDAGAVNVLYGTSLGLSVNRNQLWSQGTPGIPFVPEADDTFGRALASGDFNGDGADELAIGVPFEDHGAFSDAGAIHVLYGSNPDGLSATGALAIVQGDAGVPSQLGAQHRLGIALASGDFDGDEFADLAAGAELDDVPGANDAGSVTVLHGAEAGLQTVGAEFWHEAVPDVPGVPLAGDGFGQSVAAGDFRGDGADDLAIGVPNEDVEGLVAGAVIVLDGIFVLFGDGFESGTLSAWSSSTP